MYLAILAIGGIDNLPMHMTFYDLSKWTCDPFWNIWQIWMFLPNLI